MENSFTRALFFNRFPAELMNVLWQFISPNIQMAKIQSLEILWANVNLLQIRFFLIHEV